MDLAARRRAPIASITVALPVMMSPIITPQPPHMPVPSIMIGVQTDDRVDVFLAGHLGDRLHHPDWAAATNRSMPVPFCINWQSLSMIKPLSAQLPSSVGIMSKSLTARIFGSRMANSLWRAPTVERTRFPARLSADATAYHHHGAVVCDL